MKDRKFSISFLDAIGYYLTAICTLGASWVLKTIIEKAIVDALNSEESLIIKK